MDKSSLRPIEAAENAVETARNKARGKLIDWLDHFKCPECNIVCEATTAYDPRSAAFYQGDRPAWECPECEKQFRRESDREKHTADMWR